MAPEQLRGETTGPATDVYAFGLMLFEMITGQRAFTGRTPLSAAVKRLQDPPPSPRVYLNDLPQEWERGILRCLELNPEARFQSAGEVIRAIETKRGSSIRKTWRAFGSRRTLAGALLVVLAAAGTWVSIALLRHAGQQPIHQPAAATSPQPPETATLHYKRGLYYWNLRTQEGFLKAIEEYQKAIQADPKFASAYSGLAWVYAMQSGAKAPRTVLPEAKKYAERAISLDAKLPDAHAVLAFVRFYYDWDWKGAEEEYKTAITLNPGYASAHSNYAILLAVRNRFREAEEQAKLAEQADPVSAAVATGLGRVYTWSGDTQRAIAQFESVLAMYPQFPEAHLSLAGALAQKGDAEAAVRQISYVLSDSLNSSALADLGYIYARMNDKQLARGMLLRVENLRAEKKRYVSPCYPAIVHAALGELDEAFDLLNQGLRERTFEMVYLNINREYSNLRRDRRWPALVRSIGLTQ
jgi:tetratricopeptide (TPR) repeat protein